MKKLFIIILLSLLCIFLRKGTDTKPLNKEKYLDQKTLELSAPFDVKIDTEFLKNLKPANE